MPGTYTFRPIQANLTHDTDWLGKMDPYCSYRVGPERIKGPVCRNGGKFPKWEDATVNVPATNEPSIVVDLMDKDKIMFDDNIGSFVIDLQEVQSKGQLSKWYPVYWKQKPAGEILLEAAFQPEMMQQQIQQPIIQEQPVIVKETHVTPVIVEKVEKVVEVPATTTTQEFHSGPIIHGISQIHHGGQGIGLVPQHGGIIEGSTLQQAGFTQGTVHHGTTLNQGSTIHQGGLTQGTFQGSTIHQGGLNQGTILGGGSTIHQGGLTQGTLQQGSTLGQGSTVNPGNLAQESLQLGGLGQGTANQGEIHPGGVNKGLGGAFGQGSV